MLFAPNIPTEFILNRHSGTLRKPLQLNKFEFLSRTASMVVVGTRDMLFPPEAVKEANRQIQKAYEWAGYPERFRAYNPPKVHCYDLQIQQEATQWLDRHLK